MGTSTVMLVLCVEVCRALDRAIFGPRQAGEDQFTQTARQIRVGPACVSGRIHQSLAFHSWWWCSSIDDMAWELSDGKIQYVAMNVVDAQSNLPKVVFITSCTDSVPDQLKSLVNLHQEEVGRAFRTPRVLCLRLACRCSWRAGRVCSVFDMPGPVAFGR